MITSGFWFPIALLVGLLFLVAAGLLVRRLFHGRIVATSPEERAELAALSMTPLQKRACWSLVLGLAMAGAITAVIAGEGPLAYFDDGDARLVVTALILLTLASHLVVVVPAGLRARSKRALDERDQRVLATAPFLQAAASLVTVAAWSIALTESYRGEGIPTGFMALVFWSVLIAQVLAHSGGILVGYWMARNHA